MGDHSPDDHFSGVGDHSPDDHFSGVSDNSPDDHFSHGVGDNSPDDHFSHGVSDSSPDDASNTGMGSGMGSSSSGMGSGMGSSGFGGMSTQPQQPDFCPQMNAQMVIMMKQEIECSDLDWPCCTVQKTAGQCVWLAEDDKCDVADKCDGRAPNTCGDSLKVMSPVDGTIHAMPPMCVWLYDEMKCDKAGKCQGRNQQDCLNPALPPCTWLPMMMDPMSGEMMGGCREPIDLQATHETQESQASEAMTTSEWGVIGLGCFLGGLSATLLLVSYPHCTKRNADLSQKLSA